MKRFSGGGGFDWILGWPTPPNCIYGTHTTYNRLRNVTSINHCFKFYNITLQQCTTVINIGLRVRVPLKTMVSVVNPGQNVFWSGFVLGLGFLYQV